MFPLFSIIFASGFFGDIDLILKIVGLLFIMSFVRQHVQHPILSLLIIIGLAVFLLFDFWKVFGTGLFLYLLVTFGLVQLLVDLGFLGAFDKAGQEGEGGGESGHGHGHGHGAGHGLASMAHNIFARHRPR